MALTRIAPKGDQLKTLKQLRDDLAVRLDGASSDQNYAAMARVFMDTVAKIIALEGQAVRGTALDELSKRRTAAGHTDATSEVASRRPGSTPPAS